jgi:hypothetical protein
MFGATETVVPGTVSSRKKGGSTGLFKAITAAPPLAVETAVADAAKQVANGVPIAQAAADAAKRAAGMYTETGVPIQAPARSGGGFMAFLSRYKWPLLVGGAVVVGFLVFRKKRK